MLPWQSTCSYRIGTSPSDWPISRGQMVSIDLETTGLCHHTHKITGVSLGFDIEEADYIPIAHVNEPRNMALIDVICELNKADKEYEPLWCMYNSKFELRWLEKAGFKPKRWLDVQLLWYNLRLHEADRINGLKESAKHLLGLEMLSLSALFKASGKTLKTGNFSELPVDNTLLSYACADADITYRLAEKGLAELAERREIQNLVSSDHKLVEPVMAMENSGMLLDADVLRNIDSHIYRREDELKAAMRGRVGSNKFNPGSPAQVGVYLFDERCLALPVFTRTRPTERHPEGQPSTDTATLKKLHRKYGKKQPVLGEILELREIQARSRFTKKLLTGTNPVTGRVHPSYHLARQITGRLSSSGDGAWLKRFNFQGVPKLPSEHPHNIRRAFVAEEGFTWVSIDLSNIEVRLIANFSGDEALIEELNTGGDLHARTCRELFGKDPSDADWDKWRKIAKICNFNLAYAFGTHSLRNKIEVETGDVISERRAEEIFEAFFGRVFPAWGAYKKELCRQARKTGYATTLMGRRRDLRAYYAKHNFYGCAGDRQAVNHPIQGSCADLLRRAIRQLHKWVGDNSLKEDVRLVSVVHDELNFEVRTDAMLDIMPALVSIIEHTPEGFVVPIRASVAVGPSWGELTEYGG